MLILVSILFAILVYWLFSFNTLLQCLFAVLIASGIYIFRPTDPSAFPWGIVLFCTIAVAVTFVVHYWTKPKTTAEKPLSPSEQAYQDWCESKIDPEIKNYIEETYGIKDKNA